MATRTPPKKKPMPKAKQTVSKPVAKVRPAAAAVIEKPISVAVSPLVAKPKESAKEREARERRREALQQMLMGKRQEILKEIEGTSKEQRLIKLLGKNYENVERVSPLLSQLISDLDSGAMAATVH